MVELVWNGKQTLALEPANLINSKILTQHLCTYEMLRRAINRKDITNLPLNPTPRWHNRLILGDKSSILSALLPRIYMDKSISYILIPLS